MSTLMTSFPCLWSACCQSLPAQPVACCHSLRVLWTSRWSSYRSFKKFPTFPTLDAIILLLIHYDITCYLWRFELHFIVKNKVSPKPSMSFSFPVVDSLTWTFSSAFSTISLSRAWFRLSSWKISLVRYEGMRTWRNGQRKVNVNPIWSVIAFFSVL